MLLPVAGSTVLASAVAPHLAAGIGLVVVVLGHEAEAVRLGARLPSDPRLRVVVNEDWREGMASSLKRGLKACGPARRLWSELEALSGDVGARDVVRRHAAECVRVASEPLADLDTPADYEDHKQGRPSRGPRGMKLR